MIELAQVSHVRLLFVLDHLDGNDLVAPVVLVHGALGAGTDEHRITQPVVRYLPIVACFSHQTV